MKKLIPVLLIGILLLTACKDEDQQDLDIHVIKDPISQTSSDKDDETVQDNVTSIEKNTGVWITYWDLDTAYEELDLIGKDLDTLCYFAAYYDKDNEPFIPEGSAETIDKRKQDKTFGDTKNYLTFVNDKLTDTGSSLKDTKLLYDLLGNRDKAKAHAEKITDMTKAAGFDGIEIDYEAIKKDQELWAHFYDFVNELVEIAGKKGLKVRILFEPSAPIDKYDWPKDAEYVMMCYNLYGYGTNPGPKADLAFLKEMVKKMEVLSGEKNFALASGGFDFASDGSVDQIDTVSAKNLEKTGFDSHIDENSGDHVFKYTDDEGMDHEVWYADQDTLKLWIKTIKESGYERITIWRLGGNI